MTAGSAPYVVPGGLAGSRSLRVTLLAPPVQLRFTCKQCVRKPDTRKLITLRRALLRACRQSSDLATARCALRPSRAHLQAMGTRLVLQAFERYQKERVAFVSSMAEMAKDVQARLLRRLLTSLAAPCMCTGAAAATPLLLSPQQRGGCRRWTRCARRARSSCWGPCCSTLCPGGVPGPAVVVEQ